MADAASGRRFLRPPSLVSRKSHSFNAADRNKIKEVRLDPEPVCGIPQPVLPSATNAALAAGQPEWRSRSMNAKHSFTHQGNSTSAVPSRLATRSEIGSGKTSNGKSRLANSPALKSENSSKISSSGKQRLVKPKPISNPEKGGSLRPLSSSSAKSYSVGSESGRTALASATTDTKTKDLKNKSTLPKTATKGKSGLVPPKATVSRSASNSSRSSIATVGSLDRKSNLKSKPASSTASKPSSSVLGRLRKKGVPQIAVSNDNGDGVTLKQAVSVKSPVDGSKSVARLSATGSLEKQEKKSLVPPSKLAMSSFKTKSSNVTTSKMKQPSVAVSSNVSKQKPGFAFSTFRNSMGKEENLEKPSVSKSKLPSTAANVSSATNCKSLNSSRIKYQQDNSDVIILSNGTDSPKRFSGEETVFRRDRIDVKNLKNLLVRPYDNAQNGIESSQTRSPLILNRSDVTFSDSEDISNPSIDVDAGQEVLQATASKTCVIDQNLSDVNHSKLPNHESGIRNVQLPSRSEGRKPQKTATVAPIRRQIPEPTSKSGEADVILAKSEPEDKKKGPRADYIHSTPSQISVNSTASVEERRKSAKGIADLRQNLEETMVSLRNSQLKNRLSDEFERRISAQLDDEVVEDSALPEVPPPLPSNTSYRTKSAISGLHTISHGTRGPKLDAGDCLGPGSYTNPRAGKYSSLQRNNSGHATRSAWNPLSYEGLISKDETENISSISSEDISEMTTGISTDDISLSSLNNSPFHLPKPAASCEKSLLAKNKLTTSIESLEKSSNSTSESSRSLSSWKKVKSGSKSDNEGKSSKRKTERKNTKKKEKGSPAVGSRLAGADGSESPTLCSNPRPFLNRGVYAYRSLPRTRRHQRASNTMQESNFTPDMQQNGHQGFVRSPALKLLLRSKANKSKPNLDDIPDVVAVTSSNNTSKVSEPHTITSLVSKKSNSTVGDATNCNSFENDSFRRYGFGLSMTATQSLPRKFCRKNGTTTWSQPRSNANAAYSLPVTPDDTCSQNGVYVNSSEPYGESVSSFSNLIVPEFDNFSDAMSRSFHNRQKMCDWSTSRLQPSTAVAASNPNVALGMRNDRSYRTIGSSHDLKKRHGSALSLGAPSTMSQSQMNDENSIAMACSFLHSLAQNKAVHQGHIVEEFEKSLSHLTTRLRELSTTAEAKDTELQELRNTIEKLKQQREKADEWDNTRGKLKKKPSCGSLSSMSSATSVSSTCSVDENKPKKKRGWLKSSFKTAFGRSKSKASLATVGSSTSHSDSPPGRNQDAASVSSFGGEEENFDSVRKLKEELRQKELKLTDIRLDALSSRHQLQHLQDTMNQMRSEMESLRKENEQLHQLGLSAYSLTSSPTFLNSKSNGTVKAADELRVKIVVKLSSSTSSNRTLYVSINTCMISKSVSWQELDHKVVKIFMAHCQTVDPSCSLKLDKCSIQHYSIGDGVREIGAKTPDLLPCGFFVGDTDSIIIELRDGRQNCTDALAFQLLIEKPTAEKYINLLVESQRVVINGPIGVGKTLLANQLAGYVAEATGSTEPLIYLDAKQKAMSELQDFLHNIASATKRNKEGTVIIVLDNLQKVGHPHRLLEQFLQPKPLKGLYMICITNRESAGLKQFCRISYSNNSPPVQMYLARKLRRDYLEHQISQSQNPDNVLSLVIAWLPKCWQHINDFLELHTGSEVTIGPRMFSSCPMDASSARVWFTDLWNFSVVPYVISAVKSSQSRKNSVLHWSDPTDWVLETFPWRDNAPNLLHIRTDAIGPPSNESDDSNSIVASQSSNVSQSSNDPLLNMLMRLQEAASYDSDTNSSHGENFELSIDKALTELGS